MDEQGFSVVGYGCTTCIGNSGELHEDVSDAISENGKFATIFGMRATKI